MIRQYTYQQIQTENKKDIP